MPGSAASSPTRSVPKAIRCRGRHLAANSGCWHTRQWRPHATLTCRRDAHYGQPAVGVGDIPAAFRSDGDGTWQAEREYPPIWAVTWIARVTVVTAPERLFGSRPGENKPWLV
jgi:hypothetical protein